MRVLILTSGTGGGHNMRARAFREWAQTGDGDERSVYIERPLEHSHKVYAFGVWLYNQIQRWAPSLHHVYFNFLEVVPIVRARRPLGARYYQQLLEKLQPHVLLSVHDSLNHVFFKYAREVLGDDVKCVTYCGELADGYGFSRHWVNPEADLFIGAVPATCEAAVRLRMEPEKTRVGGFLLRRSFYDAEIATPTARETFYREVLQFDPGEFTLLLCASSLGAHNHIRFLEALKQQNLDLQVVVLCGNRPAAAHEVTAWVRANPRARVRVMPHNCNVGQLMRSVSAIVARPGTGTTSEAIVSRCPLLLNCLGGVMPQERITVKFCRKNGVAELIRRPSKLAHTILKWKRRPEVPLAIRQSMRKVCPALHPLDIVRMVTGVRFDNIVAGRIPVIEAARIAPPTEQSALEKNRPLSLRPADADSQ